VIPALLAFALWGDLPAGSFQPAFQSSWILDHSRRYGAQPRGPRPILVNLWYPSAHRPASRLLYRDYLKLPPLAGFPELPGRLEELFLGMTPAAGPLLGGQTQACRDCVPANGRFPIIVYFPGAGSAYHENTPLFEFLASHGYVVLSSSFQSPYHEFLTNNTTDASTAIRDLQMLVRYATTLPFTDAARVGAVGHSMGAQVMLEWIGEPDTPVDAFVSLDSTLEYTPRNFAGHKQLRDRLERMFRPRVPALLFARAADRPNFRTYDKYLSHAPRYEASVRFLKHDDFTVHGVISRDAKTVRSAYDAVRRMILHFADCRLKQINAACNALKSSGPIAVNYKPPRR
jgi:dienelactone hydrolase